MRWGVFLIHNCCNVGTAVLTFSREIEYIWCRPWTWISTMFVLVRYVGFGWIMTSALNFSSFIPGPPEVSSVVFLISFWAFAVFLSAADMMMILRVYAMWNLSRTILWVLLFIYVLQIVTTVVFVGIYNNPDTYFSVTIVRVLDFSYCNTSFVNVPPMHNIYIATPRFALGATLVILAVFRSLKQSLEIYKATRSWQLNRYMRQLVKDGILYFLANMLYQIACVLNQGGTAPNSTSILLLDAFVYIIFYPLIPRFIISIRELYDGDVRGRLQGIDTGFGVLSQANTARDTTVSAMVFMDVNPVCNPQMEGDMGDSDAISIKVVGEGMV
ncbi:hypothetical protein OG21DRAFT_174615 [Imleria badia]|nr:hypothetical protein OG21DRAFT_174615 [Imleria badia]